MDRRMPVAPSQGVTPTLADEELECDSLRDTKPVTPLLDWCIDHRVRRPNYARWSNLFI